VKNIRKEMMGYISIPAMVSMLCLMNLSMAVAV